MIQIDTLDTLITKYGSRKALSAIIGMYLVSTMKIPEAELWLQAVQMICIAALGISAVICQWNLDRKDG